MDTKTAQYSVAICVKASKPDQVWIALGTMVGASKILEASDADFLVINFIWGFVKKGDGVSAISLVNFGRK